MACDATPGKVLTGVSIVLQAQLTMDAFLSQRERFAKIKSKRLQKVTWAMERHYEQFNFMSCCTCIAPPFVASIVFCVWLQALGGITPGLDKQTLFDQAEPEVPKPKMKKKAEGQEMDGKNRKTKKK
jgi:hypothetical protein